MTADPCLLVVHAVDTEGPLGGDARRLPDGSPEFFDDWEPIVESLAELTAPAFRDGHRDSFGRPYRFNWFILDFTGFATNPKHRVAEYHDTYDHIAALPIELDGLYWHYHVPPVSGVGDEWSDTWLSSNECNTILARRLLERGDFPEAFRAGGTIEDDAASAWLEQVFALDFSNRVSERSRPGADLCHFDWYGAPAIWGSYHPAPHDFREPGSMRRFVYRSLDLRSRYNELAQSHVEEAMRQVVDSGEHRVLSFFSHDNRDMRPETYDVVGLLDAAAAATGVRWRSCTAVEAHQLYHGLEPAPIALALDVRKDGVSIACDAEPFQRVPFVAAELADGRFVRLVPRPDGECTWTLRLPPGDAVRIGAAVTSPAAVKSIAIAGIPS